MKHLFVTFFLAVSVVAVGMMFMGMCESPVAAEIPSLSAEEENALLSQVEFRLEGAPAGETAVFIDTTLVARLTVGQATRLALDSTERCGVSLKIRGADGEWVHTTSLGCINHAPYAAISFAVDGTNAQVSYSAWQ